jgi:hypothetical protein
MNVIGIPINIPSGNKLPTNVKGVIVSTQPVHNGLLWSSLIFKYMVWSTIFRDRLRFRGSGDKFAKFVASRFRTEIQRRALNLKLNNQSKS